MSAEYALKMTGIAKDYGENRVLKGVDLFVKPGEIHALMGENGAGKSTLMNILFGMPVIHSTGGFKGTIEIDGKEAKIDSPLSAMNYGIGMVHQEFMLIPGFTVRENIKVGREITKPTVLSRIFGKRLESLDIDTMAQDAQKALDMIGLEINQNTKVDGLPVGYMQFIEIAREIDKTGLKILVFDEPTAVLTESEAARLLDIMKLIASKGIAIIFITHRLDEVMNAADSLTVLRDGEFVIRKDVKDTNVIEIAELMIGRKVEKLVDDTDDNRTLLDDDIALSLKDFHVQMPGETVKGLDLDVRRGEILGIGGLAGQGKIGIPNGIMGLYKATGTVTVFGKVLDLNRLGEALNHRIAFVSENRRRIGLLMDSSIEKNVVFSAMQIKNRFVSGPFKLYKDSEAKAYTEEMIKLFDIRCTGPNQATGELSGGNQQKVCLARAVTLDPDILIVSEPTRGIDIGAKKLVLEHLVKINREQGKTIIVVSSELTELRSLCDRIVIITGGKLGAIMKPDDSDADYGLVMSGAKVSAQLAEEKAGGEEIE